MADTVTSMSETLGVYEDNLERVRTIVEGVRPDQWGLPTPCAEWTVHDLVVHIVGGLMMFGTLARGDTLPAGDQPGDLLGDDALAAYDRAAGVARAGFGSAGAAERLMALPVGSVPGEAALSVALADLTVHGWDLATATGQAADIPEPFLGITDQLLRGVIDPDLRRPDGRIPLFDPPLPVGETATPTERLVAFTGRRP